MPYAVNGVYRTNLRFPNWSKKRFQKSLRTKNKRIAQEYEAFLTRLYKEGQYDVLDALQDDVIGFEDLANLWDKGIAAIRERIQERRGDGPNKPLRQVFEHWIAHVSKASRSTQDRYRSQLGMLHDFLEKELGREPVLGDLSTESIKAFLDFYYESRITDEMSAREKQAVEATTNRYLTPIRAVCRWQMTKGFFNADITHGLKRAEARHEEYSMSPEEWVWFKEASEQVDAENVDLLFGDEPRPCTLLWETLASTGGTTFTEIINHLKPSDINLYKADERGMVPIFLVGTKTSHRSRYVFVHKSLAQRLLDFAKRYNVGRDELIFAGKRQHCPERRPFSRTMVADAFRKVVRRAAENGHPELLRYKAYHLRHTFGRLAARGHQELGRPGVGMLPLAKMMGHSSTKMTERYARFTDYDLMSYGAENVALVINGLKQIKGPADEDAVQALLNKLLETPQILAELFRHDEIRDLVVNVLEERRKKTS